MSHDELPAEASSSMLPARLVEAARGYAADAKSAATKRAYASDWRRFDAWCVAHRFPSLPASSATTALYIAALADAGRKVSSIERALAAISQAHQLAGHPSPTIDAHVREVMKGVRRALGTAPRQKAPILVDTLGMLVDTLNENLLGIRDRALLTLGFAGAFRRSELVALDLEDLTFTKHGIEVVIKKSKTDQEQRGRKIGIPYGSKLATCPVRSTQAWIDAAGLTDGPLFRAVGQRKNGVATTRLHELGVARIVKARARAAGLDEDLFAGHSLRAGFVTAAAKAGKAERAIMAQTGHRSMQMLRRYIRDAQLFDDNAAAGIGL